MCFVKLILFYVSPIPVYLSLCLFVYSLCISTGLGIFPPDFDMVVEDAAG
jgi:hypothetical protein